MRKFLDVDIIESLRAIMEWNTEHYKTDFDTDVQIIQWAATSKDPEDRSLLWMSRESGTWCLREREVLLRDTRAFNTWLAYEGEAANRVLAFAVLVNGTKDGTVCGNLYQLDYPGHIEHMQKVALPVEAVSVNFADGHTVRLSPENLYTKMEDIAGLHGNAKSLMYEPSDEQALQAQLIREHRTRMNFPTRSMEGFIKTLDHDLPPAAVRDKLEQARRRADAHLRLAGQKKARGEREK